MRAKPRTRAVYLIRERAQMRSLASPARQEVLDALSASGPATIAEIASSLGRRPHALYFHVRALLDVGLILQVGSRRVGKSDAAVYAAPGQRMRIHYELGSPAFRAAMRKTMRSMLRLTERDFARGLVSPAAVVDGPQLNLWCGRIKARLTAAQLREVNALVRRLYELMNDHPGQSEGALHAVTVAIVPLPGARARGKRSQG